MKNTFNWWLLLLTMTFVAACSSGGGDADEPDVPPTPAQPTITLSTTASDFTTDGGSNTISFTASTAWTAEVINSRADAWCSVSPTSGKAGDAEITVTTQPNDTPDDRSASIIIKAGTTQKTINVSQKQKDALTVTSSKFEVPAEGGEVKIELKANIDFDYTIDEKAKAWITSTNSRALKTSNLVFKVAANEETDKREGTITISSGSFKETITVYQAGARPSITLTKNEFVVPSVGETIAVEVKSNVNVEVELPAEATWISENKSRTMSTNTYYFIIDESQEYDQREALIKFTNKDNGLSETVRVVQVQKDVIVVAKDSYTVDNNGDEITIEVGHNVDFDIEIGADWITRKHSTSRGFVTENLTFVIAKNVNNDSREGTIKFTSKDNSITQTVKVYQAQEDALVVSKKDIVMDDEGGTFEIEIQANVKFKVTNPNVDWIHEANESRALTSHTLVYKVDANTGYNSREAQIVISDESNALTEVITITQVQKDAIVLAKKEYEVTAKGGSLEVSFDSNIEVNVTSNCNWIEINKINSRALSSSTILLNVSENTTANKRTGIVTISSKDGTLLETLTIVQKGQNSGSIEDFEEEQEEW